MIVSTTLSGNAEGVVGDALRSVVEHVDKCVLITTCEITDATLEVARKACGDKLYVGAFPWNGSFADARNAALDIAAAVIPHDGEAHWALTLDTDERIAWGSDDIRAILATTEASSFAMASAGGTYAKDRIIRIPTTSRWVGRVHEWFPFDASRVLLESAEFSELPKDQGQLQAKSLRDLRALLEETKREPNTPRWWYYLGDALANLGKYGDAVLAFDRCAAARGAWREEAAWAMVRAARCLVSMEQFDAAVERATAGLARCPYVGELAAVAGVASLKAGRVVDAETWANIAIAVKDQGRALRTGFKDERLRCDVPGELLAAIAAARTAQGL